MKKQDYICRIEGSGMKENGEETVPKRKNPSGLERFLYR